MAADQVIDSLNSLLASSNTIMGIPSSRLICRHALPSSTPVDPAGAYGRYFPAGGRLQHLRETGRQQWRNEAETGSLALRLMTSLSKRNYPFLLSIVFLKKK